MTAKRWKVQSGIISLILHQGRWCATHAKKLSVLEQQILLKKNFVKIFTYEETLNIYWQGSLVLGFVLRYILTQKMLTFTAIDHHPQVLINSILDLLIICISIGPEKTVSRSFFSHTLTGATGGWARQKLTHRRKRSLFHH